MMQKKIFITFFLCALIAVGSQTLTANDEDHFIALINNIDSSDTVTQQQAVSELKIIADDGHALAQFWYAEYLSRYGHDDESMRYFRLSSDQGEMIATEAIGIQLITNEATSDDLEGYQLTNKAAVNGLTSSQLMLGLCFLDGDCGFSSNEYLAVYWLTEASKNGDKSAEFHLESLDSVTLSKGQWEKENKKVRCEMGSTDDC